MLVRSTHWHAKDTPANWIALERALPASSKASFSKNRPPSANKISRVPQLRTPAAAERRAVFLAAGPGSVAQAAEVPQAGHREAGRLPAPRNPSIGH